MKASLDKKGFDRNPHRINEDLWYYEESNGLHLYQRSGYIGVIRWSSICSAIKRYHGRVKRQERKSS